MSAAGSTNLVRVLQGKSDAEAEVSDHRCATRSAASFTRTLELDPPCVAKSAGLADESLVARVFTYSTLQFCLLLIL